MTDNDKFVLLAEEYGLDLILEQNDLEPWKVIRILYNAGHLDIDDYFFTDLEGLEDED
jgi:hypothetical protein